MSDPLESSVPAPVRADRAAGAVLASAAGDALGAGYEFGPPLGDGVPVEMVGGGGFGWAPGEWTDDTQMALAVLGPLAAADPDPLAGMEAGFRAWFASDPADVGNQTRAVLSEQGPLASAAVAAAERNPDGSGNGSLMRTGPVALAHPGDPAAIAALAREVSALTHATDDCVDACVLWSVAIDHAIHEAPASHEWFDWASGLRGALAHVPSSRQAVWRARIEEAADSIPLVFPQNGWVVRAFQAALAAICSTPVPDDGPAGRHLQLALEAAVRAGGDTDTVAAIAGSLLGARWGATAVPFRWRRVIHGRRTYDAPVERGADLERLARLAFRGGMPDREGWPGGSRMLPLYSVLWPAEPLRVTLDGIQFGNVAALPDALADGAEVVISLCRMGTSDVPPEVEHLVLGLLDTTPEENPNAAFVLADLTDGLADLVAEGKRVFVHCVQAENRTPAAALAWLLSQGAPSTSATAEFDAAFGRSGSPSPRPVPPRRPSLHRPLSEGTP